MSPFALRTAAALISVLVFPSAWADANTPVSPVTAPVRTAPPSIKGPLLQRQPVQMQTNAVLIGPEDCTPFATADAKVVPPYNYSVVAGTVQLAMFLGSQAAADHAVNVIKTYGFTEICYVGHQNGALVYWKASGVIPKAALGGEQCANLPVGSAYVFPIGGGKQVVMSGLSELADYPISGVAAAKRAADIVNLYKFNRRCVIIGPQNRMVYFLVQ